MQPIQAELQGSHAELECKIKLLQSDVEEHIQSIKREFDAKICCTKPCTQKDLHDSHAELDCKIKVVQSGLEEQIQSTRRLSEDSSHWIQKRSQNDSHPSSSRVMEARAVAEDRKWRMKFDQLQDSLAEHLWRIEALDSQYDHLMRKTATNDMGLEKVASSVRELDSRLAKTTNEEAGIKESFERRICQTQLTNLSSKVAQLDTVVKEIGTNSESMEAKLAGEILQKETLEKRVREIEVMKLSDKVAELGITGKEILSKTESTEARLAVDLAQRDDLENRIRQIELMNLGKQIVDLQDVSKDLVRKTGIVEGRLEADVARQQQKLEGDQCGLDAHLIRIDRLEQLKGDLAVKLVVLMGTCEQSRSKLQRIETQCSAAEKDIVDMRTSVDKCSKRLEALEDKVAAHRDIMPSRSNRTLERFHGFPLEFRTQLRSIEDCFSRTVQDLDDVGLADKALRSHVQCFQDAMQTWVEDARKAHQTAMEALASSMQQVHASSLQQGIEIERHQEYMNELSEFVNKGIEREQCIHGVLLRIIEEDHPDLLVLLEQQLRQTSRALR
jgi:hypothetical protein